jgi:hypothetical protein
MVSAKTILSPRPPSSIRYATAAESSVSRSTESNLTGAGPASPVTVPPTRRMEKSCSVTPLVTFFLRCYMFVLTVAASTPWEETAHSETRRRTMGAIQEQAWCCGAGAPEDPQRPQLPRQRTIGITRGQPQDHQKGSVKMHLACACRGALGRDTAARAPTRKSAAPLPTTGGHVVVVRFSRGDVRLVDPVRNQDRRRSIENDERAGQAPANCHCAPGVLSHSCGRWAGLKV